ncbi:MAG: hypothetical protein JNK82_04650 [Myxococcaceae bacterium]|nr:hypothetical protein [Myxococcaceae bacterium]
MRPSHVIELPHHALRFPPTFTQAEREVVLLVLEGLSNAEIAARRGRSERTVANQIAALLEKADVYTRGELLAACAPPQPVAPGSWATLLEGRWRLAAVPRSDALRFVAREHPLNLSDGERTALEAVAQGAPNKQIAPVLGLGLRAAGRRVECAVEKLGVPRLYLPLLRALSSFSCPHPVEAHAA